MSLKQLRKQFTSNIEPYIAEIEKLYTKKGLKKDEPLVTDGGDDDEDFFKQTFDLNYQARSSLGNL
jgi:hypothetical protein